jgi:hypothetical protein
MNCCWLPDEILPVTVESAIKPPLAYPDPLLGAFLYESYKLPSIINLLKGDACETAQVMLPTTRTFSAPLQKLSRAPTSS